MNPVYRIQARKGLPGAGYVYIDFWSPVFEIMADEYPNPNDRHPRQYSRLSNVREF